MLQDNAETKRVRGNILPYLLALNQNDSSMKHRSKAFHYKKMIQLAKQIQRQIFYLSYMFKLKHAFNIGVI